MADQFIDAGATQPKFIEDAEMEVALKEVTLDASKDYGEPVYTLSREGIGFFPKGDVQAIKAPQKNGKTFLISMLIGTYFKGEYNGLKAEIPTPKVLYIDTEQHPRNTAKVYRRSCNIGGLNEWVNHPNFKAIHLRGKNTTEAQKITIYAIKKYRPDICFIDGVVDLVDDFNDNKESKAFVTKLMDISQVYDCAIPCVLHVNPSTKTDSNDKMRGHLGTILAQKASDVLCCLKTKESDTAEPTFTISQSDARNKDIRQFAFVIEDREMVNGKLIAVPVAPYISVIERTNTDDVFSEIVTEPMKREDIVSELVERKIAKKTAAYDKIKKGLDAGILKYDSITKKIRYVGLDMENEPGLDF